MIGEAAAQQLGVESPLLASRWQRKHLRTAKPASLEMLLLHLHPRHVALGTQFSQGDLSYLPRVAEASPQVETDGTHASFS